MPKRWNPDQRIFQQWLAQPAYDRAPASQGDLALELGVHESTLSKWKHLDGWDNAVNEISRRHLISSVPETLGALRREAEKGSFPHIKLLLEMAGMYTEEQRQSGEIKIRVVYGTDTDATETP